MQLHVLIFKTTHIFPAPHVTSFTKVLLIYKSDKSLCNGYWSSNVHPIDLVALSVNLVVTPPMPARKFPVSSRPL